MAGKRPCRSGPTKYQTLSGSAAAPEGRESPALCRAGQQVICLAAATFLDVSIKLKLEEKLIDHGFSASEAEGSLVCKAGATAAFTSVMDLVREMPAGRP